MTAFQIRYLVRRAFHSQGPPCLRLVTPLALFLLTVAQLTNPALAFYPKDFSQPLTRIGFGSCNDQDKPQPHWQTLTDAQIGLWIWLGDNIYADAEEANVFQRKYGTQLNRPEYMAFRKATPIIGTWDDHDYGVNDGGKGFSLKQQSQEHLLNFLDEPASSPRRKQEGVYTAYTFGPSGKQVKFILLDNRSFAGKPGPQADLLGKAQWEFLEKELKNNQAQVTFIGSGTQMLPRDHRWEKWSNFPKSRKRLLDLIRKSGKGGVLLLSGDRHLHEISIVNDEHTPYPLIEFTSSGLTHAYTELKEEFNRYRVGPVFKQQGFGIVEINWSGPETVIHLQARDMSNKVKLQYDVRLSHLQPRKDFPDK